MPKPNLPELYRLFRADIPPPEHHLLRAEQVPEPLPCGLLVHAQAPGCHGFRGRRG